MAAMVGSMHQSMNHHGNVENQQGSLSGRSTRIPVMLHKPPSASLRKHSFITTLRNHNYKLGDYTPQFSIRKVVRVDPSKGKRVDRRKHSDDFEVRRQEGTRDKNLLTSLSLEHINSANVVCCVRDSNELLHAKLASSTSRLVEKINDQAEVLYKDIKHPKAFKLPQKAGQTSPVKLKKKTSYTEMYNARQQLLDKQLKAALRRKNENKISKQRSENQLRLQISLSPDDKVFEEGRSAAQSMYPHTLPSAMYPVPPAKDYPALYDTGYSPLPPIKPTQQDLPGEEEEDVLPDEPPQEPQTQKSEGYSVPKPKITYKPYTLKDYGAMKRSMGQRTGGLGPDKETGEFKRRQEKSNRIAKYANKVRSDHQATEFPKRKPSNAHYQPPSKAEIGQQYARRIPPPKIRVKRRLSPLQNMNEKETSLLQDEILKERVRRHLQHKRILEDLEKL